MSGRDVEEAPGRRGAERSSRLWPLISLAGLVAVWTIAAALAASPLLPGPAAVAEAFQREVSLGYFGHLGATLGRVAASFLIAMALGAALGLALGMDRRADRWFGGWLVFFLNLPALVTIIL
ncbi:MAG: ABC transporter permease, partial [Pseudomonadota bacterium]